MEHVADSLAQYAEPCGVKLHVQLSHAVLRTCGDDELFFDRGSALVFLAAHLSHGCDRLVDIGLFYLERQQHLFVHHIALDRVFYADPPRPLRLYGEHERLRFFCGNGKAL